MEVMDKFGWDICFYKYSLCLTYQ